MQLHVVLVNMQVLASEQRCKNDYSVPRLTVLNRYSIQKLHGDKGAAIFLLYVMGCVDIWDGSERRLL